MKIAKGGLLRTTTGLNMRSSRGVQQDNLVASLVLDVLLHPLQDGVTDWVQVRLLGWRSGVSKKLYSDPDDRSTVKATLKGAVSRVAHTDGPWSFVEIDGFVSYGPVNRPYVVVVDGPK